MAYSKISTTISEILTVQLNFSEEKKQILAYGMEKLIFTTLGFLCIMLVSWFLNVEREAFAAVLAGPLLRKYSGGVHCSTAFGCLVSSILSYTFAAKASQYLFVYCGSFSRIYFLAVGVLLLVAVWHYAPVDSVNKPIVSAEFKKQLRLKSLAITAAFTFIAYMTAGTSIGLAFLAGLCLQTITLLPILNKRRCDV